MGTGAETILSDVTNNSNKVVAVALYFTSQLLVEKSSRTPTHEGLHIS